MKIGNKYFTPAVIPTIVFLLVFPVLLSLGFWQLDRADQKEDLIAQFKQQNERGPMRIEKNIKLDEKLNYRKATVEGKYNLNKQIFIDNKIHLGKTGVYVMTPFKLKNSEYSILVNRGWVPMAIDRLTLPKITTPSDALTLLGKLKIINKKTFTLGDQFQSNQGWPALMQWVNISEVEKLSSLKLLPYVFLLDQKDKSGFVRNWKPVVMLPEKSISYAVQWFSLALALAIIYIVVNLKSEKEN